MAPTSTRSIAHRISRDDLLTVLASIGVILPTRTKVPSTELVKKLMSALDGAQDLADLLPTAKLASGLDVREYPLWPPEEDLEKAATREPMRTLALTEQIRRLQYRHGVTSTEKEDTFKELRQIIIGFGHNVKRGHKYYCLMDEERAWGVFIRVRTENFAHPPTVLITPLVRLYMFVGSRKGLCSCSCTRNYIQKREIRSSTICLTCLKKQIALRMWLLSKQPSSNAW